MLLARAVKDERWVDVRQTRCGCNVTTVSGLHAYRAPVVSGKSVVCQFNDTPFASASWI